MDVFFCGPVMVSLRSTAYRTHAGALWPTVTGHGKLNATPEMEFAMAA
jgi:hypothetical protein